MKKMNRVLAVILAGMLVITQLAGCKPKTTGNLSNPDESLMDSSETVLDESGITSANEDSNATSGSQSASIVTSQTEIVKVDPKKKYDISGQATNLNGRTIKMQQGIIQTQPDDATTRDGSKLSAQRRAVEKKLNCKLVSVKIDFATMQASILAGDPACDIWNLETIPKFLMAYQSKLIQPIEPLKSMNLADATRYSNYTELSVINGQHWGFSPQTYGIWRIAIFNVLYANKKILASKGVTMDSIYKMQTDGTWTWDKFAEIAKKVSDPANGKYAITDSDSNFYNDLMASNGVDWIKKEGTLFTFNASDKKAQDVMAYYQKLVNDKSLSVTFDPQVGGINPDNSLDGMANDYDFLTFKAGKSAFLDSMAFLPYFGLFGAEINNIGVVPCPKPAGATSYKSYTNHACLVGIPVYGDKDSNVAKRKAVETATVIQNIFAPYKSQTEYNNQLRDDVAAFASDENFQKNYLSIYNNIFFSFSGIAGKISRGTATSPGWLDYVPKIANGSDYSTAVSEEKLRYNNFLKDLFVQK